MNTIASRRLSPASNLIRGVLETFRADCNNVIVRTGMSRVLSKRRPPHRKWPGYRHKFKNGKEYFGFTYYPNPGEIEPEWKPSELFLIQRIKPYEGNPYWEKRILKYLHLDGPKSDVSIVMNNEYINKQLWQIKHLITITPITFPDGYPEDEDLSRCRLYENGEFRIDKKLELKQERLEATENIQKRPNFPTGKEIERDARNRWIFPYMNNVHI